MGKWEGLIRSHIRTFTHSHAGLAVCFLWHFPWDHSRWPLAITVPCPVRTFLRRRAAGGRLAHYAAWLILRLNPVHHERNSRLTLRFVRGSVARYLWAPRETRLR